tara:strand:+ start:1281 stop:2087 length:807 start_codon:yes stop_codon:yes gene_type:complete
MTNTIVLTVHNKEKTISKILDKLIKNTSSNTIKLIIVLDGCTDASAYEIKRFFLLNKTNLDVEIIFTEDIWETRANNIGLKKVKTDFATIVQDDMLILQKNWDNTLLKNFYKNHIFAISGRGAHNFSLNENTFQVIDLIGREYPLASRSIYGRFVGKLFAFLKPYWLYNFINFYAIRLVVNRGPLMLDMKKLKQLNFFDEKFAPFELDDVDLCCRAFKKFGLYSAANPIYYIELNGSKKNSAFSQNMSQKCIKKNTKILINRHFDLSS